MDPRYEIARFRIDQREQVLDLLRHLWGRHAGLNDAYFAWKYERNPYIPEPAISLALHRGEVVGMYGLVGARYRLGTSGRTQDIPYPDDLIVAPEHRRRGLGRIIMREVERRLLREGCAKINLQVRAANKEAVEFYKRVGFMVDDVISLGRRLENDEPAGDGSSSRPDHRR